MVKIKLNKKGKEQFIDVDSKSFYIAVMNVIYKSWLGMVAIFIIFSILSMLFL
jgi:hypothetical protein